MVFSNLLYKIYEGRLNRQLDGLPRPQHIGVMIDGNRRWAREMGLADPSDGHRAGAKHVKNLLAWSEEVGIDHVTIYLLSTENLSRPESEVQPLLDIIVRLASELAEPDQPWKLKMVGALDQLDNRHARQLKNVEESTAHKSGVKVNLAICYGGKQEIADAVRSYLCEQADRGRDLADVASDIDVEAIADHLYTTGQPDPDLIIRTSGEQRISGFLLWQSAYSEFYFCDTNWPGFRRVDFLRAMRSFATRNRRYGK
ncbi:isoprenyl transferase [Salininema proteolyticum]|uniref:Isoprenyl transferase n=1 Tax=Salininema proteolyticum TaxID=1607685 RepID=A0ABV8U2D0_9ACTN